MNTTMTNDRFSQAAPRQEQGITAEWGLGNSKLRTFITKRQVQEAKEVRVVRCDVRVEHPLTRMNVTTINALRSRTELRQEE